MKQKQLLSGSFSLLKTFLFVSVLSLSALSVQAQTPVQVHVTGFTESTHFLSEKVYDGTDVLAMVPGATITLTGVTDGDDVEAVAVGHYTTANAGDNLSYEITFTLTGAQAANYCIFDTIRGNNGRITPKQLTASGLVLVPSKVYDGSTSCDVATNGSVSGAITGDFFFFIPSAAYLDANVGTAKQVVVTYRVTGTDASNYLAPATDSTSFTADITPKPIHIQGIAIDTTKIYDGTLTAQVTNHGMASVMDVLIFDTVMPVRATATYLDKNVGTDKPIIVTYQLRGPQAANYMGISDSSLVADITPRLISVSGTEIRLCKEVDGTTDAVILTSGEADNLADGDVVNLNTNAFYADADTGHNKNIYVCYTYADNGIDQRNYILPDTALYSTHGKIILPTQLAVLNTTTGEEFLLTSDGMCQGDMASANYQVIAGEPVTYSLAFSSEAHLAGFADVVNAPLPGTGEGTYLTIPVPADAPYGHYYVSITLTNEAEVSVTYSLDFVVNYPVTYIDALFSDVVCVNNSENIFNSYQWYHDGVAIEGATKQYYYQEGGLTGVYYAVVNLGEATEGRTCERDFGTPSAAKTLTVSPNPVVADAIVRLSGFDGEEHTLQLFNAYGQQLLSITFTGNEYRLDLSAMPQGAYLISVDGERAKALKF